MSSTFLALLIAAVAIGDAAFQGNSLSQQISRLHQEIILKHTSKHAGLVRTAPSGAKATTSTTYVTIQGYDSSTCSGTLYFQETFATNVCFQISSASTAVLSGMYLWDYDSDTLYTLFYTDVACNSPSGDADYLSVGLTPNECFEGIELETATSMPSVPSTFGVKLDGYTSSSSCSSGSSLLMEIWASNAIIVSIDDDTGPFSDDGTFSCELLPIPFYDGQNEVNYTISSYGTKTDTSTPNPTPHPSSAPSSSSSCFAGTETVQLEDGALVPISSVVVGDRVLAADVHGRTKYSSVISVPHDSTNTEAARFTHLVAASGNDIKMTPDHLMSVSAACDGTTTLMQAGEVQNGMCLVSVDGLDKVVHSKMVRGNGVHTIVTEEEMVVVNGFVASPFAHNHAAANAYYNIIRMLPSSVVNSRLMKQANTLFGSLVTAVSR